jgi:hypothetical protein
LAFAGWRSLKTPGQNEPDGQTGAANEILGKGVGAGVAEGLAEGLGLGWIGASVSDVEERVDWSEPERKSAFWHPAWASEMAEIKTSAVGCERTTLLKNVKQLSFEKVCGLVCLGVQADLWRFRGWPRK